MSLITKDDAVSPVIGTILLVAVTVIIAAVIASFVFGTAGNVQKTKVVAATARLTPIGDIHVVYQGGPDTDKLTSISIISPNGSNWYTSSTSGALTVSTATLPAPVKPDIGAAMILHPMSPSDWPSERKHVIVIGAFNDGASQVILDTFV